MLACNEWNTLPISAGSTQGSRLPEALQPDYFLVDEMSFETLLIMAKDIASQIQFFDQQNNPCGNWAGLFENNEMVAMAMILGVDCASEQARFCYLKSIELNQAIEYLIRRFVDFNAWYCQLKRSDNQGAFELQLKIAFVVDKQLSQQINHLLSVIAQLGQAGLEQLDGRFDPFDTLWGLDKDNGKVVIGSDGQEQSHAQPQTQSQHKATLQNCFSMMINSVQYLQTNTRGYLEQAMSNPTHEPALGLLMVFLKLFGKAQQQLNRFTPRHRDFYYQDILGFAPLGVTPDSAYLQLALAPGAKGSETLEIATGTRFSAGKDKKFNDIVYAADEQVTITDAKVEQLRSLYLQRDSLISPERELHYVTRVSGNQLDLTVDSGPGAQPNMAVFGADQPLSQTKNNAKTASMAVPLGIGISAPVLYLKEGHRKVEIVIGLGEPNKISPHFLTELNKNANDPVLVEQGVCDIFAILLNAEPDLIPRQLLQEQQNQQKPLASLNQQKPQNALFDVVDAKLLNALTKTKGGVQTSLIYKAFLMALLQLAEAKPLFRRILGRIFSRHTLSRLEWLSQSDVEFIADRCQQICPGDEMNRIVRLLEQDKLRTFYELYDDMFNLEITTDQGWLPIEGYAIHPVDERAGGVSDNFYGFRFELLLKQDFPAVVPCDITLHGENWQLPHPAIQFMVKPQATFFPYSIFRGLLLNTILIEVDVKGVTELVTYNQQGRLDPSKPFNPFGPQPGNHSYMVFGGEELAQKQLHQVSLNLEWAQLPTTWDGFADHYQGYDDPFDNDCFKADIALLKDGQWNTVGQPGYALFQSQHGGNRLAANQRLTVGVEHEFKPALKSTASAAGNSASNAAFEYNLKSRNGFFKLSLAEPDSAFGHQQYANVLTTTLVANSKNKKQQKLPNLPYTPMLSRFSLDYRATAMIDLNATTSRNDEHGVVHIHPFGYEQVYPRPQTGNRVNRCFLFPRYGFDGNLFMGLSAQVLQGNINLFFHLDENAVLVRPGEEAEIHWFYLADNQWVEMTPAQVVKDTTNGFLTSGIVTLDVPDAINTNNTVMPGGLYWLRAATSKQITGFGQCYRVTTHGVKVTRQMEPAVEGVNDSADGDMSEINISNAWQPMGKIPGLGIVGQKTEAFDGKQPESLLHMNKRVNERLRHKGRAVTPWDYERLILQQFPSIDQAKCFANMRYGKKGQFPGHVLIIVRRKVDKCQHQPCDSVNVSADELIQICAYVQSLAPAFVKVDVRNPEYEQLQVRCTVTFAPGVHKGLVMNRLNKALCSLLCPWQESGLNSGFGWEAQIKEIESFVSRLDYVSFVTDFSLLHIVELKEVRLKAVQTAEGSTDNGKNVSADNQTYRLNDSVLDESVSSTGQELHSNSVKPGYPWAILMPSEQHYFQSSGTDLVIEAQPTGIEEMQVGSNFIIKGKDDSYQSDNQDDNQGDNAEQNTAEHYTSEHSGRPIGG